MSVVPPHSCIHRSNGIDPVAGCPACEARQSRASRLDVRHYGRTFIDELDETQLIDQEPSA